ncbi:MAG: redox-regulated ATPase YchF [Thermoproteaceae archaeon]|nr:redox-regulated ATPase YchF [Thermoproteaceae archaeon]
MVLQGRLQIGIVGKPNAGKSTFFAAATMRDVRISPTPFTTIEPNVGIGHARVDGCPCSSLACSPRSYVIVGGVCFAPVELIDVAGLIPGAWQGRGLGNQFLDHLRRAPALIHVVDASGSTDEEGRLVRPGTHDPVVDVIFLEREIDMWIVSILRRDWSKTAKLVEYSKRDVADVLSERLAGLGVRRAHVEAALNEAGLAKKPPSVWTDDDFYKFSSLVRTYSRPIVIAANKIDVPEAEDGYRRLRQAFPGRIIVPTSAEAELALRRAAAKGLVKYRPGDSSFELVGSPTPQQKAALERIAELLRRWGSTGVVQTINAAVFDALNYVAVYPVEDEKRLSDRQGSVLPDLLLVPSSFTARDVAYAIHTELGERFVGAIDARTGRRLAAGDRVYQGLVIKILAR